jgi:hypothetical protein
MPYKNQHYLERDRRVSLKIRDMVGVMNNTKWREVFSAVAKYRVQFSVSWVNDRIWNTASLHAVLPSWVAADGIRDPGIGGPCFYREILLIRFPFCIQENFGIRKQDAISDLVADLRNLGALPIRKTDEFLEIKGYEEPATP